MTRFPVPARTSEVHDRALTPRELVQAIPLDGPRGHAVRSARIARWRRELRRILDGEDHRLAVIVGPCSVHDPDAGLEYASRLAVAARQMVGDLFIVMRAYIEKPRTVLGWKGLAADPGLDGTGNASDGLRLSRRFLLGLADLGLPAACELVSTDLHLYVGDTLTWSAIGARTTESQAHREVASGLQSPAGFKNGTDGSVQVAADACRAAAAGHRFRGPGDDGILRDIVTNGNPDCHVVLRGGRRGPNYDAVHVARALGVLDAAGLPARLMIDASHGNSGKDPSAQPRVAAAVAAQARRNRSIKGVMLESFLAGGCQEPGPVAGLAYGQSVTDACLSWEQTLPVLDDLAVAAAARR
jgi:3-deoxy-7-phosphoheptulonate synthase